MNVILCLWLLKTLVPHLCPWQPQHAHTNKHRHYTTHLLLRTASPCCAWHRHKDEIWCSAFNQRLAGWRSPLCVMEAEWWWLQTAACHLCSLVGPLVLWAQDGTVKEFFKAMKIVKSLLESVSVLSLYAPLISELFLDILIQCDVRRALELHFAQKQKSFREKRGSVFHSFFPSRKRLRSS